MMIQAAGWSAQPPFRSCRSGTSRRQARRGTAIPGRRSSASAPPSLGRASACHCLHPLVPLLGESSDDSACNNAVYLACLLLLVEYIHHAEDERGTKPRRLRPVPRQDPAFRSDNAATRVSATPCLPHFCIITWLLCTNGYLAHYLSVAGTCTRTDGRAYSGAGVSAALAGSCGGAKTPFPPHQLSQLTLSTSLFTEQRP